MSATPEAVVTASGSGNGPLIGHYGHPLDPSNRTALCGEAILGVSAFGEFEVCVACEIMWAGRDWAPLPGEMMPGGDVEELLREFFAS